MLGRNSYTREELDNCRTAIDAEVAAYRGLAAAAAETNGDVGSALAALEAPFFNGLVLVLDRFFVHRVRNVSGKDGNPVNELELLSESLMSRGGVLTGNNVIKYKPEESVLKLQLGDRIALTADDFERLSAAFLAEMERRFVERAA
jgi:hypothetical protein